MPRYGTAFDETSPLLGGSAKGAGVGCESPAKTHPVCLRQPPLHGRGFSKEPLVPRWSRSAGGYPIGLWKPPGQPPEGFVTG